MTPQIPSCRLNFIRFSINVNHIKARALTLSAVFNNFYVDALAGLLCAATMAKYACTLLCSLAQRSQDSHLSTSFNVIPHVSSICVVSLKHSTGISCDTAPDQEMAILEWLLCPDAFYYSHTLYCIPCIAYPVLHTLYSVNQDVWSNFQICFSKQTSWNIRI